MIDRKTYKEVKEYSRTQMEEYLISTYNKGFKDGAEAGDNADFKIKLVRLLLNTKGIGEKTLEKVLENLKKIEEETINE